MSAQENFNHCPQCHAFLQTAENAHRSFCKHCRFPLMLIAGKYRLVEKLGEGSTATIYLAHHISLIEDRERVVKVIKPETLSDETARLRFQREIQVTIALSRRNEHIVNIYDDFGEEPHLGHFYVMEYLQGRALQDMMYAGEPLGNWLTFRIFFQLCKAMGAAHRAGIVHRDLKPENILLVERDLEPYFLKLIDFGIAKPLRRKLDLVVTHGALGTPSYMSPEQCLNKPVDGRSDIYAMGALLYELLTGHQPFGNTHSDEEMTRESMLVLLEAHVKHKPRPMREAFPQLKIPKGLDDVVMRTLAKDPELRYQRVEDFWTALSSFAPPAYQQLELASQTALPAFQPPPSYVPASRVRASAAEDDTSESGSMASNTSLPTPPSQLASQELPQLQELASEAEDEDTEVFASPRREAPSSPSLATAERASQPDTGSHGSLRGVGYSVSSMTTLPPIDDGFLPVARNTESYSSLDAIQAEPDTVQARIDRYRSASSSQLPAAGPAGDGGSQRPEASNTSPASAQRAVATIRTPRPPSRSPRSLREQGVQELIPGGSSDVLPALNAFEPPATTSQASSPSGGFPAALQGPAISDTPRAAESAEAPALRAPAPPRDTDAALPAVPSAAPSAAHVMTGPLEPAPQTPPPPSKQTRDGDPIETAIADAIASEPALPAATSPSVPAAPADEEAPPLRLKRPKKSLRRQALLASQATVEQAFLSPEQMAALAEETRATQAQEAQAEQGADNVGSSDDTPESPPSQSRSPGDTLEEDLANPASQPPHRQASWFKAPK